MCSTSKHGDGWHSAICWQIVWHCPGSIWRLLWFIIKSLCIILTHFDIDFLQLKSPYMPTDLALYGIIFPCFIQIPMYFPGHRIISIPCLCPWHSFPFSIFYSTPPPPIYSLTFQRRRSIVPGMDGINKVQIPEMMPVQMVSYNKNSDVDDVIANDNDKDNDNDNDSTPASPASVGSQVKIVINWWNSKKRKGRSQCG